MQVVIASCFKTKFRSKLFYCCPIAAGIKQKGNKAAVNVRNFRITKFILRIFNFDLISLTNISLSYEKHFSYRWCRICGYTLSPLIEKNYKVQFMIFYMEIFSRK